MKRAYPCTEPIMKRVLLLLLVLSLGTAIAFGKSYYDPIYKMSSVQYSVFLDHELKKLYIDDEDRRETAFEKIKAAANKSLRKGDSFLAYTILTDFVIGRLAPKKEAVSRDLWNDLNNLKEDTLEFLIDNAKNSDISVSNREFVIEQLGRIGGQENLFEFAMNETVADALESLSRENHLLLRHAALIGLKQIALKTGERWESLSEDAAAYLIKELGSSDTELQRITFFESLDFLRKAKNRTEAVKLVWQEVTEALADIAAPGLRQAVFNEANRVLQMKSGAMFREQINEMKTQMKEMKFPKQNLELSLSELLAEMKDIDDPSELQAVLSSLFRECRKDQRRLHTVYSQIVSVVATGELSDYKLRLLNDALIVITHDTMNPLFFQQTAMVLLQEIVYHRESQQANIPLVLLANLMASTDYKGLILPLLNEIKLLAQSDLPVWIRRRLIGLIFVQAGDSPNEKISLAAAVNLGKMARGAKSSVVKWESLKRLKYLYRFAKEDVVRKYSANWK